MKKLTIKSIIFSLTLSLVMGSVAINPIHISAQEQSSSKGDNIIEEEALILEQEYMPFLNLIEQMPEEVIDKGIKSGVDWLNKNKTEEFDGYNFIQYGNESITVKKQGRVYRSIDWGACIGAVGMALVSNVIPWAKVIKVKKAAKVAGSMNKLVKMITRAYKHQRNLGYGKVKALKRGINSASRAFPSDVRDGLLEFFSLAALSSCIPK